jgi:hypothetical protein
MTFGEKIGKGLCFVGKHKWKRTPDPKNPCHIFLACVRDECGKTGEDSDHDWPDMWSATANPCVLVKRCRCEAVCRVAPQDTRRHHPQSEWIYPPFGELEQLLPDTIKLTMRRIGAECVRMKPCRYLGESCPGGFLAVTWGLTDHDWDEETLTSDQTSCKRQAICKKCEYKEVRAARLSDHDFGAATDPNVVRACQRCSTPDPRFRPPNASA